MSLKIKIDGVYDKETIKRLGSCHVHDLSFDCRPRSLNFIQAYRIKELLNYTDLSNIYLQFHQEKPFVIDQLLAQIKDHSVDKKIFLEFFDHEDYSFYDQFGLPYFLHLDNIAKLKKEFFMGKHLVGIYIDYDFLSLMSRYGDLTNFVSDYYKITSSLETSFVTALKRKWDSDIYPSLCDYFDFSMVSLPIDSCVEVNFRHVDLDRVEKSLKLVGIDR